MANTTLPLKQIALFADLPDDMLAQIATNVQEQTLRADEVLFHEGQEGDTLYFIEKGEIEIYDEGEGGRASILATLRAGEYFGEMALLEEKPRSASARARGDSTLLTLDRKSFIELMEQNPKLAMKMTAAISARLRTSQSSGTVSGVETAQVQTGTTKVFISYSRRDKEFVQKLYTAITAQGIDTWVDWENIPLTADWWNEIQTGIEKADAFAFVISPDSLNSEVCGREVQTAVDNHKRLIPILHRDPQKGDPMHEKISSHNWVYMRSEDELHNNLSQMLEIVNTDLGWVREHTRLRERALEWERAKKNPSFLLQGTDLQNAEQWLEKAGNKQPQPTPLHYEYIQTSRKAAIARQRALLTYAAVGLVITLILAIVSFGFFLQSRTAEKAAQSAQQTAVANADAADVAKGQAQNSEATAQAERGLAEDAQATAEAERNISATAQANAEQAKALAEQQEFIARAGRLQSLPLTMLSGQLDLALLLGIEAYKFDPSLASENTLFTTWSANPELIRYLPGHEHAVLAADWSPDRQLATAGEDGEIIIWDNMTGKPAQVFQAVDGEIQSLAWSSDGQLASGDTNGDVIVWDVANGTPANVLKGHTGAVNVVAWSPRNQLTSGGEDGNIFVWNIARGVPQYTLSKAAASILDLDWSPTGILASANSDDEITVWGDSEISAPLTQTHSISGTAQLPHTNINLLQPDVQTLAWSPDGVLASGGFQQIFLWDIQRQEPSNILQGHSLFVNSLSWSDRGELASGASDNTVIVWDLENGRPKKTYRGHNDWVQAVSWSPDGILASAALDRTVILWRPDARAGQTLNGHDGWVYAAAYSPGGQLASGGEDGKVILWNLETNRPELTLSGHTASVFSVAWSPDGQLASGGADNKVILWNLSTATPSKTLLGHEAAVSTVAWSPDGQLASADEAGNVIVWNLDTGQPRVTYPGAGVEIALAWSPSNQLTLSAADGSITIFDAQTFEPLQTLTGEDHIRVLAWSPDGQLASDGKNYQIILWDLDTGQPGTFLRGHANTITSLAWSADGRLASGAEDNTLILWDLEGKAPAFIYRGHTSLVQSVSWSPDGAHLASAALDSTVMVWDTTPEAWMMKNCSRAGRNFTPDEWDKYFPDEDYHETCAP